MPSIAKGHRGGEMAEVMGRPKADDDADLRGRDREWHVHRLQGWTYARIGRKYRVSLQYVHRRLAAMPQAEKDRIGRMGLVEGMA